MIDYYIGATKPGNKLPNPWRRYFARIFDIYLYSLLLRTVILVVFHYNIVRSEGTSFVFTILAHILMIAIEPLLLSTIGTTPGKFIFGLVLRDSFGGKLDYSEGFARTINIFGSGMGLLIPIYSWIRMYKSFKACNDHEVLPWDREMKYSLKDTKAIRGFGYIAAWGVVLAITLFVKACGSMPLNKGDISKFEYVENVNYLIDYHDFDLCLKLDPFGEWELTKTDAYSSVLIDDFIDYQFYTTDEQLTKVVLEDYLGNGFMNTIHTQMSIAYLAFAGVDKSISYSELYDESTLNNFEKFNQSFEFVVGNVKVTNKIEKKKVVDSNENLSSSDKSAEKNYFTFTLEKLN